MSKRTHEIADQIHTHGPAGAQITKHEGHIGHTGIHQAAVGIGAAKIYRLPVYIKRDVTHHTQVEAGGGNDDIGLQQFTGGGEYTLVGKTVDMISDHDTLPDLIPSNRSPSGT